MPPNVSNSSPQVLLVVAASRPPSEKRRPQYSDLASLPMRKGTSTHFAGLMRVCGKFLAQCLTHEGRIWQIRHPTEWKGEVGRLLKERKSICPYKIGPSLLLLSGASRQTRKRKLGDKVLVWKWSQILKGKKSHRGTNSISAQQRGHALHPSPVSRGQSTHSRRHPARSPVLRLPEPVRPYDSRDTPEQHGV